MNFFGVQVEPYREPTLLEYLSIWRLRESQACAVMAHLSADPVREDEYRQREEVARHNYQQCGALLRLIYKIRSN